MSQPPDKPAGPELLAIARAVQLLVFDVDGVLTDGGLYYGPTGEALKRFDVKDGHGLIIAGRSGLKVALLTARRSEAVEVRARELCLTAITGRKDKRAALEELLQALSISPKACAYMGDDLNDLAPMSIAALPACPADAAPEVRRQALFIARQPGGRGAARELVELILQAGGRWERAVEEAKGE